MSIKIDRIEDALSKLDSKRIEGALKIAKANLEEIKLTIKEDPLSVQDALAALKEIFDKLTELDTNDHNKVFAEFDGSLKKAIVEHMQILTDHAEEILNNL